MLWKKTIINVYLWCLFRIPLWQTEMFTDTYVFFLYKNIHKKIDVKCICNTVNGNHAVPVIHDDIDISHGYKGFISPLFCMTSRHRHQTEIVGKHDGRLGKICLGNTISFTMTTLLNMIKKKYTFKSHSKSFKRWQ